MAKQKNETPLSPEDQAFFDAFVREFDKYLTNVSRYYASPGIPEEDIRQETVLKLMGQIPKLRTLTRNTASVYIFRTAKSAAVKIYNHENKHSHVSMDTMLEETVGMEYDLVPDLDLRLELRRLRSSMTPREWQALTGKYGLGYSQEELGEQLGMAPDSVRMFLSRACKRARAVLAPEKVTGGGDK